VEGPSLRRYQRFLVVTNTIASKRNFGVPIVCDTSQCPRVHDEVLQCKSRQET
jgi:hypothetical protein